MVLLDFVYALLFQGFMAPWIVNLALVAALVELTKQWFHTRWSFTVYKVVDGHRVRMWPHEGAWCHEMEDASFVFSLLEDSLAKPIHVELVAQRSSRTWCGFGKVVGVQGVATVVMMVAKQ